MTSSCLGRASVWLLASLNLFACVARRVDAPKPTTNKLSAVDIGRFVPEGGGVAWASMSVVFTNKATKQEVVNRTLKQEDFSAAPSGQAAFASLKVPYGDYLVDLQYFAADQKLAYRSCEEERQKVQAVNQPQVSLTIKICDVKDRSVGTLPENADVRIRPINSDPTPSPQPGGSGVPWLAVKGSQLVTESGQSVMLRGVSTHGLQWYGKFANESVVKWLKGDWKISVIRASLYVDAKDQGYLADSSLKNRVTTLVDAAVKEGIYAIIDWHIYSDNNPKQHQTEATAFFKEMAQRYSKTPNVLFEICSEPSGDVQWDRDVKPYATALVATIRELAPKNIILIGTPSKSRDVDAAAASPVSGSNLAYTFHFYSGTSGQDLRTKVEAALAKGVALFASEWGTSGASGNDGLFTEESDRWLAFLSQKRISWVIWNLSDKDESTALLKPGASATGGWSDDQLSASGQYVKAALKM